jgi:hypothetical protein
MTPLYVPTLPRLIVEPGVDAAAPAVEAAPPPPVAVVVCVVEPAPTIGLAVPLEGAPAPAVPAAPASVEALCAPLVAALPVWVPPERASLRTMGLRAAVAMASFDRRLPHAERISTRPTNARSALRGRCPRGPRRAARVPPFFMDRPGCPFTTAPRIATWFLPEAEIYLSAKGNVTLPRQLMRAAMSGGIPGPGRTANAAGSWTAPHSAQLV